MQISLQQAASAVAEAADSEVQAAAADMERQVVLAAGVVAASARRPTLIRVPIVRQVEVKVGDQCTCDLCTPYDVARHLCVCVHLAC